MPPSSSSESAQATSSAGKDALLPDKLSEKTPLTSGGDSGLAGTTPDGAQFYTILSIAGLIMVNVVKVQLTAHLFESQSYPTAYSFWSAICTIVLLIPVFLIKPSQFGMPTREMLPILTAVVAFTTLDMAFQNMALAYTSTALVMCIMATVPFWTVMIETLLNCKLSHVLVYCTVCLLVFGAVLVSLGSPITKTSALGTACACVAVLCSASKAVFTHDTFKKYKKVLSPMALLFWVDVMMVPIYTTWTLINGELPIMLNDTMHDMNKFFMLTMTASLGGVRALMGFYVLSFVSATSSAVVQIFTQDLNIIISIPLQHIPVGHFLVSGLGISMSSSGFYTFIKTYKPFLKKVDETCGCAAPAPAT